MTFFQEAQLRWKTEMPPFFTKLQRVCKAGATFGTGLAGLTIATTSKLSWIVIVGGTIAMVCTGAGFACQFVMDTSAVLSGPTTIA